MQASANWINPVNTIKWLSARLARKASIASSIIASTKFREAR